MGKIGFGCYRISSRSNVHRKALITALENGCSLLDTSANYTNGESEELIGSVLKEYPQFRPIIVTKAGYIQGQNLNALKELNDSGLAIEELVEINETLKHSIHPDFLKNQIEQSLKRLQKESIDIFLLHNPEYYFRQENSNQEDYYTRIKKAFIYLESEVKNGRIKSYGISSNNFVLPLSSKDVTNLAKVIEVAKSIGLDHHFTTIQFPFNLIEIGALEKFGEYGDESLLELAKLNNLTTLINRPLNAFTNDQLVRLASYEAFTQNFNKEEAQLHFDKCITLIEAKWKDSSSSDELVDAEDFKDLHLIKQITELWQALPSPDAVEQVYYGHFFPFLARIWGQDGLSAEESAPFYQLFEHSLIFSRINMSKKALEFKKQATEIGLIPDVKDQDFAPELISTYLNYGFDFVLVGMKKPEYVDQLKSFF